MFETVLSRFIDAYSNKLVNDIFGVFYGSGSIRYLVYALAIGNLVWVMYKLSEGQSPKILLALCITFLFIAPVRQGKYPNLPAGYFLVSTIGNLMSANLEKVLMIQLKNGADNAVPPGYFMNAMTKSQGAAIKDPEISRNLDFVVQNCIPDTANKNGKPSSVLDLFSGPVLSSGGAESYELNIDPQVLSGRIVKRRDGTQTDCLSETVELRQKIRSNLRQQNLTKMEGLEVTKGRDGKRVEVWNPVASNQGRQINKIALNVAEASAIQKHFMRSIYRIDDSKMVNSSFEKTTTAETMMALQAAGGGTRGWLTRTIVQATNLPTTIARLLNLEGVLSTSMDISRMNEKGRYLQYTIAYTQLVIKLSAVFCFLLLLTPIGKKVIVSWIFAWIAAENAPLIITIYRTVSNNISMAAMGMTDPSVISQNHPAFLNMGVNFNAVTMVQKDLALAMKESIAIEMNIFRAMMVSMPILGVGISHFGGNHDSVAKAGSTIAKTAGRTAVVKGGAAVGGVAGAAASTVVLAAGSALQSGAKIGKHGS